MKLRNARYLSHDFIDSLLQEGDIAVDATAGNGHDTLYLAQKVGERGHVYAFDVQQAALDSTKERLAENGIPDERVTLILSGHERMADYVKEPVRCVLFNLGWLPSGGGDSWTSYVLPAITLGVGATASFMRTTRSSMLEVIRQDYIRTARAKGAGEGRVVMHHALRNAMIPVITVIGLQIGTLLGGAVVNETVFSLPGLGTLMINAINQKNEPVVLGCLITFAIIFSLVNLLIDILYAFIDPRIKSQYK